MPRGGKTTEATEREACLSTCEWGSIFLPGKDDPGASTSSASSNNHGDEGGRSLGMERVAVAGGF